MIDNPVLTGFCDETLRPLADLLSGLLRQPRTILDAVAGKGLSAALGTTDAALLRAAPWADADYAALGAPQVIGGADSGGRTTRTNFDAVALIRVLVSLQAMADANPQLGPLVQGWAVNPRS